MSLTVFKGVSPDRYMKDAILALQGSRVIGPIYEAHVPAFRSTVAKLPSETIPDASSHEAPSGLKLDASTIIADRYSGSFDTTTRMKRLGAYKITALGLALDLNNSLSSSTSNVAQRPTDISSASSRGRLMVVSLGNEERVEAMRESWRVVLELFPIPQTDPMIGAPGENATLIRVARRAFRTARQIADESTAADVATRVSFFWWLSARASTAVELNIPVVNLDSMRKLVRRECSIASSNKTGISDRIPNGGDPKSPVTGDFLEDLTRRAVSSIAKNQSFSGDDPNAPEKTALISVGEGCRWLSSNHVFDDYSIYYVTE